MSGRPARAALLRAEPRSGIAGALVAIAIGLAGCSASGQGGDRPAPPAASERAPAPAAVRPPRRARPAAPERAPADRCTRVVIDPGHDSEPNPALEPIGPGSEPRKPKDPGGTRGVVTGLPEHAVALSISLELRRLLRAEGYCVTMTRVRPTGRSIGNVERAQIANRAGATLFLRVHLDSSTDPSRRGSSTLYPVRRRGWTDDILPGSRTAARALQGELVAGLGTRDLGTVARADLTGFNWSDVPAALVEVGFQSNPAEDRRLADGAQKRRAARALARGVRRFTPPRRASVRSRASRAHGLPTAGRLVAAVRLPAEGADFFTWDPVRKTSPNRRWRRHGTDRLVRTVLAVLDRYARAHPSAERVGIGDLSRSRGGDFGRRFGPVGHVSHQNGLDVDVYYPRRDRRERAPRFAPQVDRRLAQDLVDRFVRAGAEHVFVGPSLDLHGPPGVVQALDGHDNHLHVRLPPG